MKVKLSSLGANKEKEYDSLYEWNCFCQGGGSGLVLKGKESYQTAFFEAFPEKPSCFIRGEGRTVELAEKQAWKKYIKIKSCKHEMERRNRTDGYGYCKHCSYSSMVFEPLTKCCKCGIKTAHATDHKERYYCKKHAVNMPKNPSPSRFDLSMRYKKVPRKRKKLLKKCATAVFRFNGTYGTVKAKILFHVAFTCEKKIIDLLFRKHENDLIEKGLQLIKIFNKNL